MSTEPPVVIGVGLTDESSYVLRKVCGLIDDPDRIVAVHVFSPSNVFQQLDGEGMVLMEDLDTQRRESTRAELAALCEPLGIENHVLKEGNPAHVLQQLAQERKAGVIAVGSHGYHGWRAMLGETANSVLHGAPCDVFAVMTRDLKQTPSTEFKNILVAVDMTDEAQDVINRAITIRKRYDAKLSALTVVKPFSRAYPGMDTAAAADLILALEAQTLEHYQDRLTELANEMGIDDCEVRRGSLSEEIHARVAKDGIDLVVMGSHARHGVQLMLGSAPNAVLHGLGCDLLAMRLQQGIH